MKHSKPFERYMKHLKAKVAMKPGDIYEDCNYHPVLCIDIDYEADDIWGISLIDGSSPRSCSLLHCGVVKLTPEEAWKIKTEGPLDPAVREEIPVEKRWW